jgi:hypothetical protein
MLDNMLGFPYYLFVGVVLFLFRKYMVKLGALPLNGGAITYF